MQSLSEVKAVPASTALWGGICHSPFRPVTCRNQQCASALLPLLFFSHFFN
jgi:hypothetical protein